ncbi:MAG: hypothetical protein QXD11_02770 [Candidatus Micrarchaeaceae archaeon]
MEKENQTYQEKANKYIKMISIVTSKLDMPVFLSTGISLNSVFICLSPSILHIIEKSNSLRNLLRRDAIVNKVASSK